MPPARRVPFASALLMHAEGLRAHAQQYVDAADTGEFYAATSFVLFQEVPRCFYNS